MKWILNPFTGQFDAVRGDADYDGRYLMLDASNDPVTGALVIQPAIDTTTAFQVLDADGGTPVLNVDTTNERVGIGTNAPAADRKLHVYGANDFAYVECESTGNTKGGGFQGKSEDSAFIFTAYADGYPSVLEYAGKSVLQSEGGALVFAAYEATGELQVYTGGRNLAHRHFVVTSAGFVGINQPSPDRQFHVEVSDAVTNVITYAQRLSHITSGTAAASFGTGIEMELEDDGGTNRVASYISTVWDDPATAAYKGRLVLSAVDSGGIWEGMRIEGSGAAAEIGFFGVAAVVRPTALTAQLTTITHTAPGTPDYALQDLIDSGVGNAWGFATHDEGNTLLSVVANLQTRVSELETKFQALGLLT